MVKIISATSLLDDLDEQFLKKNYILTKFCWFILTPLIIHAYIVLPFSATIDTWSCEQHQPNKRRSLTCAISPIRENDNFHTPDAAIKCSDWVISRSRWHRCRRTRGQNWRNWYSTVDILVRTQTTHRVKAHDGSQPQRRATQEAVRILHGCLMTLLPFRSHSPNDKTQLHGRSLVWYFECRRREATAPSA